MRLYFSPTSPYVRKVMIVLHETGQLGEVELVTASGTPLAPAEALLGKNPLTKVPALERDDGPTLFDSRVICAYLDARAGGGLYGSGDGRWDSLTLEALADGVLDAALLMTYEGRLRPEDKRWDSWTEAQWDKIGRACAALESRWLSHLSGRLDIGQIAVACALSYVDFRHAARDWRSAAPGLDAWHREFESRAAMIATRPPPE
ncbi:Glutathione S-transferase [Cribrihabitans marinus]|uniref:Glutathione S-transferase n=1 Tax=Cribrihabitans marinus TaxID=1227549 RepID=A0A1H7DNC1_9RHOB|nr:glutathione S-transferase [Cribrihabitans marinus]GGH39145.1 glutathione S-transferase [Cribrihabitans marinus]SEK00750.1 Glutathione S-transferase [Cribrihabitans marinus]